MIIGHSKYLKLMSYYSLCEDYGMLIYENTSFKLSVDGQKEKLLKMLKVQNYLVAYLTIATQNPIRRLLLSDKWGIFTIISLRFILIVIIAINNYTGDPICSNEMFSPTYTMVCLPD